MEKLEYAPKDELSKAAQEVLDYLKPKALPIWQIKEILRRAARLAEWTALM